MKSRIALHSSLFVLFPLLATLSGCTTAQKSAPHMGFGGISINAEIDRSDIVVMRAVEGRSSTVSYLFGLYQVVDGNKQRIFGVPLFKDKYTQYGLPENLLQAILTAIGFRPVSTIDRAYYKALEKAPKADVILHKRADREDYNLLLGLYSTSTVTVRGKAAELRSDR